MLFINFAEVAGKRRFHTEVQNCTLKKVIVKFTVTYWQQLTSNLL